MQADGCGRNERLRQWAIRGGKLGRNTRRYDGCTMKGWSVERRPHTIRHARRGDLRGVHATSVLKHLCIHVIHAIALPIPHRHPSALHSAFAQHPSSPAACRYHYMPSSVRPAFSTRIKNIGGRNRKHTLSQPHCSTILSRLLTTHGAVHHCLNELTAIKLMHPSSTAAIHCVTAKTLTSQRNQLILPACTVRCHQQKHLHCTAPSPKPARRRPKTCSALTKPRGFLPVAECHPGETANRTRIVTNAAQITAGS